MQMWWRVTVLALLLGHEAAADEALYDFSKEDMPLVQLDDSNFEATVVKDDGHLWVVEFYADVRRGLPLPSALLPC